MAILNQAGLCLDVEQSAKYEGKFTWGGGPVVKGGPHC